MENTFTKTFLTDLLGKTLFKKGYLNKDDYTFNTDFIREHRTFLSNKTETNQWLSLEFVNTMFDLDKIGYQNFRQLLLDDLTIFQKVVKEYTETTDMSQENLLRIIDTIIAQCINNGLVDGLLILFIQEKVGYLDQIIIDDIEKGSLPKEEFELLVDYYL